MDGRLGLRRRRMMEKAHNRARPFARDLAAPSFEKAGLDSAGEFGGGEGEGREWDLVGVVEHWVFLETRRPRRRLASRSSGWLAEVAQAGAWAWVNFTLSYLIT